MNPTPPPSAGSAGIWPYVPVALIATMLLGLGTLARIAVDDPHFALERDYYQKAVNWDRTRAEQRASESLGWTAELEVRAEHGRVALTLTLLDAAGLPLRGANVEVEAFPNAFATEIASLRLEQSPDGRYRASLPRSHAGLWEFRFSARRAGESFVKTLRADVSGGGAT